MTKTKIFIIFYQGMPEERQIAFVEETFENRRKPLLVLGLYLKCLSTVVHVQSKSGKPLPIATHIFYMV